MEKNGETFTKHTEKHKMWNYVYYIYCLQKCKPETEYSGIESYVTDQYKEKAVNWFPSNSQEDSKVDIEELMNNL